MSQDNRMNGAALPVVTAEAPAATPTCGGCRFAVPVPGDLRAVECHWGPPAVTTLSVAVPGALGPRQGLQKFASFPQVARDWHCFRHEARAPAAQDDNARGLLL